MTDHQEQKKVQNTVQSFAKFNSYSAAEPEPTTVTTIKPPIELIKELLPKLQGEELRQLIEQSYQGELAEITEQAKDAGYQEGKKLAEQEVQADLAEMAEKHEEQTTQLSALFSNLSVADMAINITEEQDCLALIHKAITLLSIEFCQSDERVRQVLKRIAVEYIEEQGVEVYFSQTDQQMIEKLALAKNLSPDISIKTDAELTAGSYRIKTDAGSLDSLFERNFQQLSTILQQTAASKQED